MTKNLYFLGDIHGNFQVVLNKQFSDYFAAPYNLIQIGDFGLGFHGESVEEFQLGLIEENLAATNSNLYIIRGNHDSPLYWVNPPSYFENLPHIHLIQDFFEFTLDGLNFYAIGGAISIDRTARVNEISWWPEEQIDFSKYRKPKKPIDIMLTHSAPTDCFPVGSDVPIVLDWCRRDKGLFRELVEERKKLQEIVMEVKPKKLLYGHFHQRNHAMWNGIETRLLNVNEFLKL